MILLALLARAPLALAQAPGYEGEKSWQEVCERAKAQPLPLVQPEGPLPASKLASCDATALYYGLGDAPDYRAAVQCGWYQRAHPESTVADMVYGPGVLTMLYANGRGVQRSYELAIHFACEEHWAAPAEMEGRIGHLEQLRDSRAENSNFDLCDDATSGLSMGFCTSIATRTADAVRSKKIASIAGALPAGAKGAFARLQAAEAAFEDARTGSEVDLSGTARAMFELEDERRLRDQFLINLQRFAKGDVPAASGADLARLDGRLNEVYREIQSAPASAWQYGTVKPEGIRATEGKWLGLEDAWMNFARLAYPALSQKRVRAELVRLRLDQLQALAPK